MSRAPQPAAELAQALEPFAAVGSVSYAVRTPDGFRPMTEAEARALPAGRMGIGRACLEAAALREATAALPIDRTPSPTLDDIRADLRARVDRLAAEGQARALAPWRALAAAVATPGLIEAVLRDWRGRDPEARVSWDHAPAGALRFCLSYLSYWETLTVSEGSSADQVRSRVRAHWRVALEHEHAARGR